MSTNTNNLGLFKWDKNNATDKASQFDIDRALNQNWDKIDAEAEKKNNEIKELKSQLPTNTATGEVINITDATDIPIKDFKIDGKSEQVTNILPTGYTQVDYIESTGTQYIDTGIVNSANIRIVDCVSSEGSDAFSGATPSNDWSNNSRYKWGSNGSVYYGYASNSPSIGNTSLDTYYIYDLANGSQKINDIEKTTYTLSVFSQYTITLFCLRQGENVNLSSSSQRRKYTKIYNNNNIVRHFIPCYRNSDNVVGMYDLINNVFYTNQGTGTFNYGGILPNPNAPVDIETITGDTKVVGKNLLNFSNKTTGWGGATANINSTLVTHTPSSSGTSSLSFNSNIETLFIARGKTITFSRKFISGNVWSSGSFYTNLKIIYEDGTNESLDPRNAITQANYTQVFSVTKTLTKNVTNIQLTGSSYGVTGMTSPIVIGVQLEIDSIATSYEPYKEIIIPLGTTELAKVGSVADKLVINTETGVVSKIKNVDKKILTGADNWVGGNESTGNSNYIYAYTYKYDNEIVYPYVYDALCDKLAVLDYMLLIGSNVNSDSISVGSNDSAGRIRMMINKNRLSSANLAGIQNWLNANNITLYHRLATPTTETITTLTQEQLEILKPNVGENTYQMITNLGRTNINIEYYQNIGILINNLTALVSST